MKKFLIALCFVLPVLFSFKSAFAEEQHVNNLLVVKYIYSSTGEVYTMRCSPSRAVYGDVFPSGYPNVSYTSDGKMRINFGISTYIERFHEDGSYGGSETAMGFTFPVYQVYNGVVSGTLINDPFTYSEFDDSITLGRFFYTRVDFFGVPLSDNYYIWWGLGNATNVKLEYYNVLTQDVYYTENRTNSTILQYSAFNPSDYNISDNTYVGCRIIPYDSIGNYGPSDSLGFIAHSNITVSEPWSDSPYIEPVLNVNGLDDVRPYINKYTVTTTSPTMSSIPKEQYSPNYVVNGDTTEIEKLLQYIIDNMNNNVSDDSQQIIINSPVTYVPIETDFDTPTFKNDFKNWKNNVVDYLMQFNGTPFGEPFAHLVTVILILSGLALALLIIKRL